MNKHWKEIRILFLSAFRLLISEPDKGGKGLIIIGYFVAFIISSFIALDRVEWSAIITFVFLIGAVVAFLFIGLNLLKALARYDSWHR